MTLFRLARLRAWISLKNRSKASNALPQKPTLGPRVWLRVHQAEKKQRISR